MKRLSVNSQNGYVASQISRVLADCWRAMTAKIINNAMQAV